VSVRATLDRDIIPRNTWNASALAKSLAEIRRFQQQGVTVLCGHDDAQWQSLGKGADAYD
jgi:N-acyl homoserine lactone hydrolase